MKKNLAHGIISSLERGILREFGAVEAGDTSIVVSGPEELLGVIESKASDWSRDSMCSQWGQRQSVDLFRLL
jgi:hypothetical protein